MTMTTNNPTAVSTLTFVKFVQFVVLFLAMLPAAIFAYKRPSYNWDMLPYMAIVMGMDQRHPDSIHSAVYEYASKNVPPEIFHQLSAGSVHRQTMASNASAFYDQLPFYTVKPLYTSLSTLFYRSGVSLTKSTVLPSIIAYLLMGGLLFYWLRRHYPFTFSIFTSLLLMYSGFMISVAQLSTPDGLSALFVLCSFYFIIEKQSPILLFVSLLLSVWARIDNTVFAFFVLSFLLVHKKLDAKHPVKMYLLMVALVVMSFFVIVARVKPRSWSVLYYPTFVHYYNASYTFSNEFSFSSYFSLLYSKLITGISFSSMSFFLLLCLGLLYDTGRFTLKRLHLYKLLCLLILLLLVTRFFLFPDVSDRFYIAYYLVITLLFIKRFIPSPHRLQPGQVDQSQDSAAH